MNGARRDAAQAIEALIDANERLRAQLETNAGILRRAVQSLEAGMTMAETMESIPSIRDRRAAEEGVRDLYASRSAVRLAVVTAAIDEGMSIDRVAASFGIPLEEVVNYVTKSTRLMEH